MKAMNKLDTFKERLKVHPIIIVDNSEQKKEQEFVKDSEMSFDEWEAWVAWRAWEAWVAWRANEYER